MNENIRKPSTRSLSVSAVLGGLLSFASTAGATEGVQSIESIRRAASAQVRAQFVDTKSRAVVTAGELDARLRLVRCGVPLEASLPRDTVVGAQVSVRVGCRTAGWTVYVPVHVEIEMPVLVLQKPVASGVQIGVDDVVAETRQVEGVLSAFVPDAEGLVRHHSKRALPAGTVLLADMLVADPVVLRGQQVTLVATLGGLEVRAPGRVMTDAAADARVRVQNLSSQRIVEGIVVSADLVRVTP